MDISNNDVASSPVASGTRRKSGRATKVPQKFVPDAAPSSQAGSANSKRKRTAEEDGEGEEDASEIDEEEEDSPEEAESAEEEEFQETRRKKAARPRAKAKKPAAKKAKVNGDAPHDEPLAVKLPAQPRKTAAKRVAIADEDAEGLYGMRPSCPRRVADSC